MRLSFPSLPVTLVLAFGLRLVWALAIGVDPVSDSAAYDIFATNIVEHGVYGFEPDSPGAYWAVGTAGIYAAAYAIFGIGAPLGIVTVNLISALAVVWLVHDLGRRWYGETAGRAAAFLFAIWPVTIQYSTVMASEVHFMALSLAGLSCWDRVARSRTGLGFLLLAGMFFGAATYVRPIALLIPAALAIAMVLKAPRRAGGEVLKAVAVTAMIFALVAPWSARNERVLGEAVFMSTNFWVTFWMGNSPGTTGAYRQFPPEVVGMGELEREAYLKALALDYIKEDPVGFVTRTAIKAVRLHDRETIGVAWNRSGIERIGGAPGVTALKILSTGFWYGVLALAFWGIAGLARRDGLWAALLSVPVWLWTYNTAIHAIIIIADRYHMPAIPMIAILAGCALAGVGRETEAPPAAVSSAG